MKSILTIGEILVEIMATDKGDGFLEPIKLVGPFPSGAPAIFIDQAARFGQPAAIIGCVGNDDFGRVNLDRLRRDGVDVKASGSTPRWPRAAPSSDTGPMAPGPSSTTSSTALRAHCARCGGASRFGPQRPSACDGHGAFLAAHRRGCPRAPPRRSRRAAARFRSTPICVRRF